MRKVVEWNQREEIDWLEYTVQPPLGIVSGDYYIANNEFGAPPQVQGHLGSLEVVVKDGKLVFVEFNEIAMDTYYNQYFCGQDKRRSDYGIWQASKPRQAKAGHVLTDGMLFVEAQMMGRQSLEGEFDLLAGASGSMRNLLPLASKLAEEIKEPSKKKFYSIAEDFGYGITGWLKVIMEGDKIVACRYDEVFADHQADIRFPELKRYYKQSKYNSPCYQDPFPKGWDRHVWAICFKGLMELLEKNVLESQDLFAMDGLPYLDGENQGEMWDADKAYDDPIVNASQVRYPSWDNYLKLAKKLTEAFPEALAKKG